MNLLHGDCLEEMKKLKDNSVDLILCDLPYGTTASAWDKIIDFDKLWNEYNRLITKQGAIVLFASGQFTYKLINSQSDIYRYKWIWVKNKVSNFVNSKNRPMTKYEEICVFSKGITANTSHTERKMHYYPQGVKEVNKVNKNNRNRFGTIAGKRPSQKGTFITEYTNYPSDVLFYDVDSKKVHPNQKPIALLEYLIKTYTKENETVLDNCMGSGSTGIACKLTNREFIGIEKDDNYFELAKNRIQNTHKPLI